MQTQIELDDFQKKTVYQMLCRQNLEGYQAQVEAMMLGLLPPAIVLQTILTIIEETKAQVWDEMARRRMKVLAEMEARANPQ